MHGQLCDHPSLDRIAEGQIIDRFHWLQWDAEKVDRQSDVGAKDQSPISSQMDVDHAHEDSDIDSTSATVNSESDTELCDLESLMENQIGSSVNTELPDIDEIRAELTPVARPTNPPASPPQDF